MATYIILNIVFIILVIVAFRIRSIPHRRAWMITFAALLLLTTIFDNLIIHFDIVAYDSAKILGIHIGGAPIEDFFYCILAVFLIPALWHTLEKNHVA